MNFNYATKETKMKNLILSYCKFLLNQVLIKNFENYIENQFEDKLSIENYMQLAVVCYKTGERTSGMNKICFYDCMWNAITISNVALCPLSIKN